MTYNTARKIIDKHGIIWSNYFDLESVERAIQSNKSNEAVKVKNAINWMKVYLLTGKK